MVYWMLQLNAMLVDGVIVAVYLQQPFDDHFLPTRLTLLPCRVNDWTK